MNNLKKFAIFATIPLLLFVAGCSVGGSNTPDPKASSAVADDPTVSDPLIKGFGQVITYSDGVSISVSAPTPYSPGAYAAGVTPGYKNVYFKVVVTNGSKKELAILGFPSANSGDTPASSITDFSDSRFDEPTAPLLPGHKLMWLEGFSVKDVSDITFSFSPNFDYDNAVFDSKTK